MADVFSEEDIAWLISIGIKRSDLDVTIKYYPSFTKVLLENKKVLEQAAKAVKPDDRHFIFSDIFALPNLDSFIRSGAELAVVCTHLIKIYDAIGLTYLQSLMTTLLSKGMIKSISDLEKVSNIAQATGKNAINVLGKGLLAFDDILKTLSDVETACSALQAIANASGKQADSVFNLMLPTARKYIRSVNDILPVGYAVVEAWKQNIKDRNLDAFIRDYLAKKPTTPEAKRKAA